MVRTLPSLSTAAGPIAHAALAAADCKAADGAEHAAGYNAVNIDLKKDGLRGCSAWHRPGAPCVPHANTGLELEL